MTEYCRIFEMSELIVPIAGLQGSGKTTEASLLQRDYDFTVISPPLIIAEYADANNIDLRERNQWAEIRHRLGDMHGSDWLAQMAIEAPQRNIVIDGLSTIGDYDTLHAADELNFARVAFVSLWCSASGRFDRVVERADAKKEIPESVEQMLLFESLEYYSESEFGVARMAVMDEIPSEMTIVTEAKTKAEVHSETVHMLKSKGFLG